MIDRSKPDWWKGCVVYQIYPRSFMDSNGDGIGDLCGITERLDYLADLGIDLIWLGPVCKSPNRDMGYDVSDYTDIMHEFGTLEDFDDLLAAAERRGIGLIVDLVLNHSSDRHPWFTAAKRSPDSATRDYYIWRDGDNAPPNNWMSLFGGPAWTRDETSGQYYLHLFSDAQPDLNWDNRRLRAELYKMMRFWLDRGVAGLRLDVISFISKPTGLPSAPGSMAIDWLAWYASGPRLHEHLREMRREVLSRRSVVTIGEAPGVSVAASIDFVDPARGELDMLFLFDLMGLDRNPARFDECIPWRVSELREKLGERDAAVADAGWNSNYLGNHDYPRMLSRFGDDRKFRVESGKMLATLLLTLRGTPYIYNGDEIGMTDMRFDTIDEHRDILTLSTYRRLVREGIPPQQALARATRVSRDNARTPMQWDATRHAGFTRGERPWIAVNPNHAKINVEAARADPDSIYHHYRRLIRLRREYPQLVNGDFQLHTAGGDDIIAYTRSSDHGTLLVLLNFSTCETGCRTPGIGVNKQRGLLACNYPTPDLSGSEIRLRPYEAIVAIVREP